MLVKSDAPKEVDHLWSQLHVDREHDWGTQNGGKCAVSEITIRINYLSPL